MPLSALVLFALTVRVVDGFISTCDSIPCQNFGQCTQTHDWRHVECHCRFGFKGNTCQTHVCESDHPCRRGSCERDGTPPKYFHCACPDSYTGEHCETLIPTTTTTETPIPTTTLPTSTPQTTTNPLPTLTIAQTTAVPETTTIANSTLSSTISLTSPTSTEGAEMSTTTTLTTATGAPTTPVSEYTTTTNSTLTPPTTTLVTTPLFTTTTTLPPTTTSVMTSSASHLLPQMHTCFKYGIVHDIASSLVSSHPNASTCEETGTRKSAEAFVLNSCKVGEPSTWNIGLNVMENCLQIPHYTPVFSIHGNHYNSSESVAAIFLECLYNPDGIKIAIQHCDTPPTIEHVTGKMDNTITDPTTYYTIQ
ncbi:uncharacterized protein LOC127848543 isoform X2 [Dreissena polymorpha]|uniref:uncharacterized protein LOC127848543 isoform X2 n=1 Tax=Dreissena polymorpha TaxID=45954 RepID=UPI0022651DC8|nr:uncharacterized protein LOC127848543 isoform X2 [Dreissena polymorpha]